MGRPPTPTRILQLRDTWRKDRHGSRLEAPAGTPERPEWLTGEARAEWDRITERLANMGILASADRALLVAYCSAWGDYREASEALQRDGYTMQGSRGLVRSPWVSIRNGAADQLLKIGSQFGLSPVTRERLSRAEGKPDDTPKSRFFS